MRLRHTGLGDFYGPASLRERGRLLPGLIRGRRQTSLPHQMTKPRLGSFIIPTALSSLALLPWDLAQLGVSLPLPSPWPLLQPRLPYPAWGGILRPGLLTLPEASEPLRLRRAALPIRGKAQPADTQHCLQHSVPTAPSLQTQPAPPSTGP